MTLLDSLLVSESDKGKPHSTGFANMPITNTPTALLNTLDKFMTLESWEVDTWDMSALNPNRQKFLARLGRKYTMQALRRMGPERRYPILLSFLKQTLIELTDESIDIFDVCIASRHKKAQKALQDYQTQIVETTETHSSCCRPSATWSWMRRSAMTISARRSITTFHAPTCKWRSRKPTLSDVQAVILTSSTTITAMSASLRRSFWRHCPFNRIRMTTPVLEAIEVFRSLNTANQRKLPDNVPLDFVADNWRRFVMPQGQPKRRAYELCTLSTLRDKLRSGDIYLPNSRRYTDPETFLIPRVSLASTQGRTSARNSIWIPRATARLSDRAQQLKDLLPRVDRVLDRSDGIRIEDGELIVPMDEAEDLPESVQALDEQIRRRIPDVDLTDLLLEVDQWTGFSQYLTHAGGGQPRTDDLLLHLHAASPGTGQQHGIGRDGSQRGFTYDRLAWTSTWYLEKKP